MVLLSSPGQLFKPFLERRWRRDGRCPYPHRAHRCLLSGAPGLAWVISTARHPPPSICLPLIKQHQSHWRPAAWQSSRWGPQGTDCPCRPPPPPIGVCSKDHRGGCSEMLQLKFHARSAPSQGSPKSFPGPHSGSAAGQVLVLGVHLHKARVTCKNPALGGIKP